MAPGTTILEPVASNHKPDLSSSLYEISEYLEDQQAYDLFDFMLRELLTTQPQDPLQHMIDCLESQIPAQGPLQVFVSSAPGVGRTDLCRRLAENYGLDYISAGELLRGQGVKTESLSGLADDNNVSDIVLDSVMRARSLMRGFVLDGFPRTRIQACKLKERKVMPTHVLVLKATRELIIDRQQQIESGKIEGEYVPMDVLEGKLNQYTCHSSSALESYAEKTKIIDASLPPATVYAQMEQTVRMLPRSKGPGRPPRVLMFGPRGSGVREHASRLASRLGAVFIDGGSLSSYLSETDTSSKAKASSSRSMITSIDVPNLKAAAAADPLGILGVRLRQEDCKVQGYVMCGFDAFDSMAQTLANDVHLCPTRVVALKTSLDVCIGRLRNLAVDSLTGKVWTTLPHNDVIRSRLQRNPEDAPAAVEASHESHTAKLQVIAAALDSNGKFAEISADGEPEDVFGNVVDFVERPLSLPPK